MGKLPYPADDSHLLGLYIFTRSTKAILRYIYSYHQEGVAPVPKYIWFPKYSLKERLFYWQAHTKALTVETLRPTFVIFNLQLRKLYQINQKLRHQSREQILDFRVVESLEGIESNVTQVLETLWEQLSKETQSILSKKFQLNSSTFGDQRAKDLIDIAVGAEPCFAWFLLRTALLFGTQGIQAYKAYLWLYWLCKIEGRHNQALKYRMMSIRATNRDV